jgi:hypothetical protein
VEHCVRCVKEFIDAGVDHAVIRPIGADLNAQFRIYLEEILPALNAANESQVVTRLLPYSDV